MSSPKQSYKHQAHGSFKATQLLDHIHILATTCTHDLYGTIAMSHYLKTTITQEAPNTLALGMLAGYYWLTVSLTLYVCVVGLQANHV